MSLRPYQRKAVSLLHRYFNHNRGNPVLEAPTAAGKSMIQSHFIRDAVTDWPGTRVLALCHVKELVDQNANAMRRVHPDGDIGVCSSGLDSWDYRNAIIFGGIQTVSRHKENMGAFDLIFVDEAHLVPKASAEGQYRRTIQFFRERNPKLKVIGFTATPYRLDGGLLTSGENRLFTDLISAESAGMSIQQLIDLGFLSPLTTEPVSARFSVDGVKKQGGDYVLSQLGKAVAASGMTEKAVQEMVALGQNRKSWLVFATDVAHAHHVYGLLNDQGIVCRVVTGQTPKTARDKIIDAYRRGDVRCLINVSVLTTGFDAPQTDLVAFMRPTESTALFVQMCGRGMRIAEGKTDCLVLDFAGNIERHGPVDDVKPKLKRGEKGEEPMRECPECGNLANPALPECPECGHTFEIAERETKISGKASVEAILSKQRKATVFTYRPTMIKARLHRKPGKPNSVRVDWQAGLNAIATEWLCPQHGGYASEKAREWWRKHMPHMMPPDTVEGWVDAINDGVLMPREMIIDRRDKYPEILSKTMPKIGSACA